MADVELKKRGWNLSSEGIEECKEADKMGVDDIIKVALDSDFKHIGGKILPEEINRGKLQSLDGPLVLQVQKIRNVTSPKENEESSAAPRMLRITLTDGHISCSALEIEPVNGVGLTTPPGTKLLLKGKIQINHGFLLVNNSNIKVLGGHVTRLVENWELKRKLAKHTREALNNEDGPPPFVPFGQRINRNQVQNGPRSGKENFKSLEANKENKNKEDDEFEQQRQATIAVALAAKEDGKGKTFTGKQTQQDKDIARIVEMGFTADQALTALRQNYNNIEEALNSLLGPSQRGKSRRFVGQSSGDSVNNKTTSGQEKNDKIESPRQEKVAEKVDRAAPRGGRRSREETDDFEGGQSRPSAPATLFDFLETKIGPIKEDLKNEKSKEADNQSKMAANQRQNRLQNLPPRLQNKYLNEAKSKQGYNDYKPEYRQNDSYREGYRERDSGRPQGLQKSANMQRPPSQDSRRDARGGRHDAQGNSQYQNDRYNNDRYSNDRYHGRGQGRHPNQNDKYYNDRYQQDRYQQDRYHQDRYQERYQPSRDLGTQAWEANQQNGYSKRNNRPDYYNNRGAQKSRTLYDPSSGQNEPQKGDRRGNRGSRQLYDPNNEQPNNTNFNQGQGQRNHGYQGQKSRDKENDKRQQQQQTLQQQQQQAQLQQQQQQFQQQIQAEQQQQQQQMQQIMASQTFVPTQMYQAQGQQPNYRPQLQPGIQQVFPQAGQVVYVAQGQPQLDEQSGQQQSWREGDFCLAKYWEDQQWYKAQINGFSTNGNLVLTFIEYGNQEEVLYSDVRPMPKQAWVDGSTGAPVQIQVFPQQYQVAVSQGQGQGLIPAQQYTPADQTGVPGNFIGTMEFRRGGGGVVYTQQQQAIAQQPIPPQQQQPVAQQPVATQQQTQPKPTQPTSTRQTRPQQQFYTPPNVKPQ